MTQCGSSGTHPTRLPAGLPIIPQSTLASVVVDLDLSLAWGFARYCCILAPHNQNHFHGANTPSPSLLYLLLLRTLLLFTSHAHVDRAAAAEPRRGRNADLHSRRRVQLEDRQGVLRGHRLHVSDAMHACLQTLLILSTTVNYLPRRKYRTYHFVSHHPLSWNTLFIRVTLKKAIVGHMQCC